MSSVPTPPVAAPGSDAPAWVGWRWPLVALVVAWVATGVLFRDTVVGMVTIWHRSETFSHCFLVPPIALWLAWRRRHALQWLPARPAPLVLPAIAAMAALWLLGDLVAVNAATQFALVALWVLAVPLLLGLRVAWALLFPLAFLFFSVPIGEFLMPQLMEGTADFTVAALRLSGVPVHREGLQFVIPSGHWSVVEACSGVRYLIASATVGALYANLTYRSARRRALFVLVSLVVPIVANWVRAYMIVMLGHLSGNELATGVDHLVYGWLFFGIVIALMFVIGSRWAEPEADLQAAAPTESPATQRPSVAVSAMVLATLAAFVVLIALPDAVRWGLDRSRLAGSPQLAAPRTLADGWLLQEGQRGDLTPAWRKPSAVLQAAYAGPGDRPVGLYIGYYRNQDYDRKLVTSDNVLVQNDDPVWARTSVGRKAVAARQGRTLGVRVTELRPKAGGALKDAERVQVWQLYWIDGWLTDNDYLAKLYSAWQRLRGRGDESAVLVIYASQTTSATADSVLSAFLADNLDRIESLLAGARGSP